MFGWVEFLALPVFYSLPNLPDLGLLTEFLLPKFGEFLVGPMNLVGERMVFGFHLDDFVLHFVDLLLEVGVHFVHSEGLDLIFLDLGEHLPLFGNGLQFFLDDFEDVFQLGDVVDVVNVFHFQLCLFDFDFLVLDFGVLHLQDLFQVAQLFVVFVEVVLGLFGHLFRLDDVLVFAQQVGNLLFQVAVLLDQDFPGDWVVHDDWLRHVHLFRVPRFRAGVHFAAHMN